MSLLHVSTSIRPSTGRYIQRHTSTANSVEVPPTWLDLYKIIIRGNCTKAYKGRKFCQNLLHMYAIVYLPDGDLVEVETCRRNINDK